MSRLPIKIMALDVATTTGYVIRELDRNESAIKAYSLKITGDTHEEKAVNLGPAFRDILITHRPHFIAIEAPRKDVQQHKKAGKQMDLGIDSVESGETTINPASVILPNQLTGAILGQIGICKLPWCLIGEGTWRKSFLGFARKKGWTRPDYKKAARQRCDMLSILVTNDDMADAVGVAWAVPGNDIFKSFEEQFRKDYEAGRIAA